METINLLFVCTAGRCRSPIAAAIFEEYLKQADSPVSVGSVGLRYTGEPTPSVGISLLDEFGVKLQSNRSTELTRELADEADLILGMTREHVRDIVDLSPDAWPKTFTMKDFARRAEHASPRRKHQRVDDWLAILGENRSPYDLFSAKSDDDLFDPFGQRAKVWRQLIAEVDVLAQKIVPALGLTQAEGRKVVRIQRQHEAAPFSTDPEDEEQPPGRVNVAR